ncbi:MAG: hypothetical protein MR926_01235, partial [Megasphaera elsdenii]|nr:hypothetical protein [Megasphaera elsdenii]
MPWVVHRLPFNAGILRSTIHAKRTTKKACRFIAAGFFLKIIPFIIQFVVAVRGGLATLEA